MPSIIDECKPFIADGEGATLKQLRDVDKRKVANLIQQVR
jgi:hypothetical protein